MRGLITAGGKGTRFGLKATNKHLAPVYGKAMVHNALGYLLRAGIEDVCIVTSPHQVGAFIEELGTGENIEEKYGHPVRLHYATQDNPLGGIADAIYQGKEFATMRNVDNNEIWVHDLAVVLGDNIFEDGDFLVDAVKNFSGGAVAFYTRPSYDVLFEGSDEKGWKGRFGMIQRNGEEIISIQEKPSATKGSGGQLQLPPEYQAGEVLVGAYIFGRARHFSRYNVLSNAPPKTVFERIKTQKPSSRGQLEVTDLLLSYLADGALRVAPEVKGWWCDCGNPDTWLLSSLGLCVKNGKSLVEIFARAKKILGGKQ